MALSGVLVMALSLALIVPLAGAQDTNEFSRIARLSYVEGHVSFQHSEEVDWTAASINLALQSGDRIYTGEDGRAEIEFDDGSVLRLAEKADIAILSLKDDFIQFRMLLGLSTLTVGSSIGFEVNTPAAAFNARRKGVYRFDVHENGDTDGIVRKGLMEAANNNFSERLEAGELVHVSATGQEKPILARYTERDAWDEWIDRRTADAVAYESKRYLPDYVYPGVRDLDRYGRWTQIDDYGSAWVPQNSDPGWTPYLDGRWNYRPYWGWTWVSYEPWGWLPYHYGRWFHSTSVGWCWIPGPSFGFHFWSPGLVRFYQGPSWVSWCPLGPGDYYNVNSFFYNPAYRYRLNQLRVTQRRGPEDLVNRNVPGAFRTVTTDQFTSGERRTRAPEGSQRPWQQGRVITDRLMVTPTAQSYAPIPERSPVRPRMDVSRPVVVRTNSAFAEAGGTNQFSRTTISPRPAPSRPRNSEQTPQAEGERRLGVGSQEGSSGTSSIWNRRTAQDSEPTEPSAPNIYQSQPAGDRLDQRRGSPMPVAPPVAPRLTLPVPPSESRPLQNRGRGVPGSSPENSSPQPGPVTPFPRRYERSTPVAPRGLETPVPPAAAEPMSPRSPSESRRFQNRGSEMPGTRQNDGSPQAGPVTPFPRRSDRPVPETAPRDMNRNRFESEPRIPRDSGQPRTWGGDSRRGTGRTQVPGASMGPPQPSAPPAASRGEARGAGGNSRRRDQ